MIDPADAIEVLLEELKRQKAEGVLRVGVSSESIQLLKSLGAGSAAKPSTPLKSAILSKETIKAQPSKTFETRAGIVNSNTDASATPAPSPPVVTLPSGTKLKQMEWLQKVVSDCEQTRRHLKNGIKPMLGFGSLDAKVVLVGDLPGIEELEAGRPFVGDVGVTLQKILKETGLTDKDIYLVNSMVWRPETATPHQKAIPKDWEISFNKPYILSLLKIIRPQCVMALGQQAVHTLKETKETISHVRGVWQEVEGIPLMPTFHPNYILNSPSNANKRKVWEDYMKVMEKLGLPISAKQRDYFLK